MSGKLLDLWPDAPVWRRATEAELQAQVDALPPEPSEDELHERFLETYEPVLTRLPEAVGTSPEQPEPSEAEAAPSG